MTDYKIGDYVKIIFVRDDEDNDTTYEDDPVYGIVQAFQFGAECRVCLVYTDNDGDIGDVVVEMSGEDNVILFPDPGETYEQEVEQEDNTIRWYRTNNKIW